MNDDRKIIWTDLHHLEAALWNELQDLHTDTPPPWERLTRKQLTGIQSTMTGLIHKLRSYRDGESA